MGCGCGKRSIKVNIKNAKLQKPCPKCGVYMGFTRLYSPKAKGYIKKWECPRCKFKAVSKR